MLTFQRGTLATAVGDIVIVKDDHLPRGQWWLGMVREILKGRDGLTRAAILKVASCDRQQSILRIPIQLLSPLEMHSKFTDTSPSEATLDSEIPESKPEEVDADTQVRPKRAAARRADELRREWIAELEEDD